MAIKLVLAKSDSEKSEARLRKQVDDFTEEVNNLKTELAISRTETLKANEEQETKNTLIKKQTADLAKMKKEIEGERKQAGELNNQIKTIKATQDIIKKQDEALKKNHTRQHTREHQYRPS